MNVDELSFRDIDWLASLRGVRSLRDFARIKRVQVAQVSKVFRKIERCIGGALFVRSPSGVTMTELGERYAQWAEEFLLEFHRFHRAGEPKSLSPVYTIGSYAFIQSGLLTPAIARERRLLPYRFRILELNPLLLSQVQQIDSIPIVLHLGTIQWPSTMSSVEIGSVGFGFYMGKRFVRPGLRARDLEKLPFITPAYYSEGRILTGSDRCPVPLRQRQRGDETSTVAQAIQLLNCREQVAFLPDCSAHEAVKAGLIARVPVRDYPSIREKLYLSLRSDSVPSSLQKALMGALSAELTAKG